MQWTRLREKSIAVVVLLLVALLVGAQQDTELLREVDPGQAQRLEEYNRAFLQEQTYFASRYRIVQADVNLLRQAREITVTPFDDVMPFVLTLHELKLNGEDIVSWLGRFEWDPEFKVSGNPIFPVRISAAAWDLEESGTPVYSDQNRFEFSELWEIDENGQPVGAPGTQPLLPPQTPEQIERHARLQRLQKHVFFSVYAVFDVPGYESKYVLQPLKYTPRYSVMYEIPRDTLIPIRTDILPGDAPASEAERQAAAAYTSFIANLPDESGKQVRGDVR